MKNRYSIPAICFLFLCYFYLPAQTQSRCGMMQYLQQNPNIVAKMQADEVLIQNEIAKPANNRTSLTAYVIPVVVHVVWHTAAENISISQVQSQIDVLNEDFGRTNADTVNTPLAFQSVAANTHIQFCLAQRDTNGNPTNGIEYTQTSVTVFSGFDIMSASTGGADPWDYSNYVNLWTGNLSPPTLGYSSTAAAGYAAIVSQYSSFGLVGTLNPVTNKGRNVTHFMGHCFDLIHIWGDDNGLCTGDDLVGDTPNQGDATYGCPTFPVTDNCTSSPPGIMFMNFMDYSDDRCMNIFTQGQAARMNAALNIYYSSLLTSLSCSTSIGISGPSTSDSGFELFPDPANSTLTIILNHVTNFAISDLTGQIVIKKNIFSNAKEKVEVDISSLPPGIYFVKVGNGVKRFVKE